ncbi:MAG: hypothetical protein GC190_16540 [Alphaproteobacteria bacterium]|nr:hypothetical protein [Alphaproteobacteria bacterium]
MDWGSLSALASVAAGVGALASLIFLALQIRQNALATTAAAMSSWLADYNGVVLEISRDAGLTLILRRGLTDFAELDKNDQMRFHAWMVPHMLNAQTMFLQRNTGTMDRQVTEQILMFSAAMLKMKGGQEWWSTARAIWRLEFVAEMDKRIEQVPPITNSWPWFSTFEK